MVDDGYVLSVIVAISLESAMNFSTILVIIGLSCAGFSALVLTLPFMARMQWFKDLFVEEHPDIEIVEHDDDE
jgi:hypothetical protein